jgi:hypothetical protein
MSSSRKTPAVKSTADARLFDFDSDDVLAADGGICWFCAAYLSALERRQRSYTLLSDVAGMRGAAFDTRRTQPWLRRWIGQSTRVTRSHDCALLIVECTSLTLSERRPR